VVGDLIQDVFVKVQARLDTLKDESRLQCWLYQITRNAIIDHFRGRKPEEGLPATLDLPELEQPRVLEKHMGKWLRMQAMEGMAVAHHLAAVLKVEERRQLTRPNGWVTRSKRSVAFRKAGVWDWDAETRRLLHP
jgi:DNA-directed RNA polymerase specialized sigma24 family protein